MSLLYERLERATVVIPIEKLEIFKTSAKGQGWTIARCLPGSEPCTLRVTLEKVLFAREVELTTSLHTLAKLEGR